MDSTVFVSEHFRLLEFTRSETADRTGLDNTPPMPVIDALRCLCIYVLEPLRAIAGVLTITSGYRSLEVNKAIGSKDTSQHILGEAADIVSPLLDEDQLMRMALTLPAYDQVIREFPPGGWVHISYKHEGPNRRTALLIDQKGTHQWI